MFEPKSRAAPAPRTRCTARLLGGAAVFALLVLPLAACGGGGGSGFTPGNAGLALMAFEQDGVDNMPLNTVLEIRFDGNVDPASISAASVQVREGPAFGKTVPGVFLVDGATVYFEPRLPGLCDLSDGGFQPDTQYRLQVIGFPEEFSVRNTKGQHMGVTRTFEFRTRVDSDPQRFVDQVPGDAPSVLAMTPAGGSEAVPVEDGNRIVLQMSENIDPCTVSEETVTVHMYEIGDKEGRTLADGGNGNPTGFATPAGDTSDQSPGDPFTWSAGAMPGVTVLPDPQRIDVAIELQQDFKGTQIVLTPRFGLSSNPLDNRSRFPENALIVVQLSFNVSDFAGLPLTPFAASFTTENLELQSSSYEMANEGETPYLSEESTADIDTARAPGRVQGYLLFAGDGDNGSDLLRPSLPGSEASDCEVPLQANSGGKDDFDPIADVLLDTGSTPNTCPNSTDGSTAVVWEFRTLRIRNGVTVRVTGVNPAILLVQGDVEIDTGGRLLVRADGQGGAPQGRGGNGYANGRATSVTAAKGGIAVAGGGDGGDATKPHATPPYGKDGLSGYGSEDGQGVVGGEGAGEGGVSTRHVSSSNPWPSGASQGGGGGGHATAGADATSVIGPNITHLAVPRGAGGEAYPSGADANRMLQAEAGGGGGAAGYGDEDATVGTFTNGGGAGGAAGGFVDITSSGNIFVFGTIDAAGSNGGSGGTDTFYGAGGGGGGAGGGIRLLTPGDLNVTGGTLTAAGGSGGASNIGSGGGLVGTANPGGDGGLGRIVLEDSDSVVSGLAGANVVPAEGATGFYRGIFDANRFQGGGLTPAAVTDLFAAGPMNPTFLDPIAGDFVAGVPTVGAPGVGKTALLIEVRGYQLTPDGTADLDSVTDWFSVGSFTDTGIENMPEWRLGHPGDVDIPADNALDPASPEGDSGSGFGALNLSGAGGFEFLQVRITIYLPETVGPFDPGTFLDHWSIRFDHDQ